jgi:hypothetical protein
MTNEFPNDPSPNGGIRASCFLRHSCLDIRASQGATGGGFGPPVSWLADQAVSSLAAPSCRQWHQLR